MTDQAIVQAALEWAQAERALLLCEQERRYEDVIVAWVTRRETKRRVLAICAAHDAQHSALAEIAAEAHKPDLP